MAAPQQQQEAQAVTAVPLEYTGSYTFEITNVSSGTYKPVTVADNNGCRHTVP
jgi:hypothetical protein